MKPRLLPLATIAAAASAVAASGQSVRPESLSYMSRLLRLNEFTPNNLSYSRDNRWLAFDAPMTGVAGRHVYVVAATGGTPVAVTSGTRDEIDPRWTTAGDLLAFYSSEGNGAVMTIAIDPTTGHATGQAKRVTIDSLRGEAFDVAPDGGSVAYLTPTGADKSDIRIVPITGGPTKTLATLEGGAGGLRFDRDGSHIYYWAQRLDGTPRPEGPPRDIKRIAMSGGPPATMFTIPQGLMGIQIDPTADRVICRDGDHVNVLTLTGDSVASIAWAQGFRGISSFGFTPDGSSLVTPINGTQSSIRVVPLDGAPARILTDGNGSPWPDYWLGDHIFVSDRDHGVETLLALDGTKRPIRFDLRKANGGTPMRVVDSDPFPDAVHFAVKGLDTAGDTSLFIYDSRTGDGRLVTRKLSGSRAFVASGPGDDYLAALGEEVFYRNVRNGIAELHALAASGRDRIVLSFPLPKQKETFAFAPGRVAHAYQRGDTAHLDVTMGSEKPVQALVRPNARMGEIVFNRDGSSLYADVLTGHGPNSRSRGAFLSTANARTLARPARWVETVICWHPTWLPNGAGVLEFCTNETGTKTWVSRIPANGPATPQPLTQRETAAFWDYAMSPDGKYVAVPAVTNSGTTLWRIDLRAAAKAPRGPQR